MSTKVADRCLELLNSSPTTHTLDLTGGAPELNTVFRHLVAGSRYDCLRTLFDTDFTEFETIIRTW